MTGNTGRPAWLEDLASRLPTLEATYFSRFVAQGGGRRSAVLVLFSPGPDDQADVLLTQRAAHMRSHPGQVSFPGGRLDAGETVWEAALREAAEEVGLRPEGVEPVGEVPGLHVPVSRYDVHPVVGWWPAPYPLEPRSAEEVERVALVPVADLVDPANRFSARHSSGVTTPGFLVQDLFVWGFTAGVLHGVLRLAGLEQPWDAGRVLDVP